MRPNRVFLGLAAAAGLAVITAALLAAEAHGMRRQMNRAWLRERAS
jgi:hypothetical protein